MARVPFTGGPLNELNSVAGISAPHRSVPIMQLIRVHRPRSASELEELIEGHYHSRCACRIVSTGTVQDFGRALYEAQSQYWGEPRFTLQECIQWEYDLFVLQSLRGDRMEALAAARLSAALAPHAFVQMSDIFLDCELRIDLEVLREGARVAGIQIKPATFFKMRKEVQESQARRHASLDMPVYVLCYDADGEFVGLSELARALRSAA